MSVKPLDEYRLPLNTKPTHYDITVRTDLERLTFDGFVKVHLNIKEATSAIVFNTAELELGDASIYSEALKIEQIQSSRIEDTATERATVQFETPLPAGSNAIFQVGFSGKLTGSMVGYYRSMWEDQGKTKAYALTQFEPTAARRAFPCWDEPLLKATFALSLVSRADSINLNNMPVASEEPWEPGFKDATTSDVAQKFITITHDQDKWKITKFEKTPLMSTYIVAYANGYFEHLETSYTSPISGKRRPLRIYATSDCINQAQFALDVTARALPLYEQVFEIEYPLPKLDTLVASDFDAGAMENWGLITGRTSAYLVDSKSGDLAAKKNIATTQSHEIAHMWFGNITTMEWWNYLYLNEGFATLMGEVIIADKLFPEWKVNSKFITLHLNDALRLDAKLSSHPIEVDCPDANQINQIFDSLSYSKAASVLRMLANYVGEEHFLKGVSIYLKKHLYGNSVTKDLWEGVAAATGIDVNNVMENWITKIGFPVLTVTEERGGIRVRQDRFLETGSAEPKDNETIWNVPLSLLTVNNEGKPVVDRSALLDTREKFFAIDTSKPFKLNAGTTGVYRVLYTPERFTKIAAEAAKGEAIFSLDDRIGLVHDATALAKAGYAKVSTVLDLLKILKHEKEYLVWDSISTNTSMISSTWWENTEVIENLNAFRRELFSPLVKELGYDYSEQDSADISLLRTCAIGQAAAAEDKDVIHELRSRFAHFAETGDDSRIPADLLRTTLSTVVRFGGRKEYDLIKGICEKPKSPSAKIAAMYAMGASQDLALAEETLQYTLTNARDQDVIYFFRGLSSNFKTRRLLAKFFKENYDVLYKRFQSNFTLKYLVTMSFSAFSTTKDYEDIEAFFKGKDISKYNLALSQCLDGVRAKAAWLDRSTTDISDWLEKWKSGKL